MYYYENGKPKLKEFYHQGVKSYKVAQRWTESGEAVLTNGTGNISFDKNGETYHDFYKDSVITISYFNSIKYKDKVYIVTDQQAMPKNGLQQYYKDYIVKTLRYPTEARRKGVEGKVFVEFIVEESGKLLMLISLKGLDLDVMKRLKILSQNLRNGIPQR